MPALKGSAARVSPTDTACIQIGRCTGIGIRLPETLVPMLEIGWGFEGAAAQVAADQEGGEVPQRGVKAAYHAYGSCVGIGLFYRKLKRKI